MCPPYIDPVALCAGGRGGVVDVWVVIVGGIQWLISLTATTRISQGDRLLNLYYFSSNETTG